MNRKKVQDKKKRRESVYTEDRFYKRMLLNL